MAITEEQFYNTLNSEDAPAPAPIENEIPPVEQQENTPATADNSTATDNTPPASPATPATPTFNLDEELVRITNGEVKTKDELAEIINRSKSASEFETRVKTYEQENAELKAKAEANPFANDLTAKLDALYRSNASESQIQAFMNIQKVNLDALSPMDASSLALQIKHGLTSDEAKTYLAEKYGIDPENPEAQLNKSAEIALKVDSTTDREFLKSHKAEVSQVPEDKTAQMQALQEQANHQRVQAIQPIAKTVVSDVLANAFKEVNINGKSDNDAIKIPLPISDEKMAALQEATMNYVTNFDIKPDDSGKEAIANFVKNSAWIQNGPQWLIEAANARELQVRAEYNNPTGKVTRGDDNPDVGKTSQEKRTSNIMAALDLN